MIRSGAMDCWQTISAEDYRYAFQRFGGSFAVHPRVVALVAALAKRPVRYAGLIQKGELIAAVALWGEHIVATHLALKFYRDSRLIDIGESEVVLPIAEGVRITVPFMATMISNLHADNIINLERETRFNLTFAKGLLTGDHRLSSETMSKRRREIRRFQETGGRFRQISDFSAGEVVEIFTRLFEKRWNGKPLGKDFLRIVFQELHDMMCGDVLLFGDRPVAIPILYKHETPHWLFVNGVQGGFDPEFGHYALGNIMHFRNIRHFEEEAIISNKTLRHCFGWNDEPYKARWTVEVLAYRLAPPANFQE